MNHKSCLAATVLFCAPFAAGWCDVPVQAGLEQQSEESPQELACLENQNEGERLTKENARPAAEGNQLKNKKSDDAAKLALLADSGQDAAMLRKENELLAAKLEAANLKIEKLQKEITSLKGAKKKAVQENEVDLFQPGTAWSGSRHYTQNGSSNSFQDLKLVILTREGKRFTGEIHFTSIDDKQHELPVTGTATQTAKGAVVFKTDQKGVFQQSFNGVLAGGQISFTFSGTGVTGSAVKGTGNLKL